MATDTRQKICLVIGDPVTQSLSPVMHNAAYKALGIESEYVFRAQQVKPAELAAVMAHASSHIHAIAVTIPHKEAVLEYIDMTDGMAKEIGAVNTVFNVKSKLIGYNTDCPGAIISLKRYTSLEGKNAVVLGSGGSARAIIYGLVSEKCNVIIYSRNEEKAKKLAETFGCKFEKWEVRNSISNADIIVNTTPIGKEGDELPVEEHAISSNQIIFDINYSSAGTALLNAAKRRNAIIVDGLEMLLQQGILQFEIYTGLKAPVEAMRNALQNKINYAGAL